MLNLSHREVTPGGAFDAFRKRIRALVAAGEGRRRRAGTFAVEILGKRLLSCPTAFAESWRRWKEGLGEATPATEADVESARRAYERETGDDPETQAREATAASVVGSWLKGLSGDLAAEIAGIDAALDALGFGLGEDPVQTDPSHDARIDSVVAMIERLLRRQGTWRDDERLVVFTEYKTTLDYLLRRLRAKYDGLVVQQLLEAIAAIHARGTTILLAEQNAQAAVGIASRGYVLESGRGVLAGSREALLGNEDVKRAYLGL